MIAFGEVHPGEKIGELIPGGGYMTRILSKAVGPTGQRLCLRQPAAFSAKASRRRLSSRCDLDDTANYGNVQVVHLPTSRPSPSPEPLDLVWTSQNYHDMHNPGRNLDINAANKAVYGALKPGGIYIVLDHQSAKGVDFDANAAPHRHAEGEG